MDIGLTKNIVSYFSSRTRMLYAHFPKLVEDSWHLRQRHHCDGLFRVPIPSTQNAKSMFSTAIFSIAESYGIVCAINNHVDGTKIIEVINNGNEPVPAKFAELIVADADWVKRELEQHSEKAYTILGFSALPYKDVPIQPMTMINILTGKHAKYYDYNMSDMIESTLFWSKHCMLAK